MVIGTLAAIGLGLAGAGAAAGAISSSKAAGKAADATQYAADQSAQVQREQLQAAQAALNPYQQAGIPAMNQINALLGLTPTQPAQTTGQMNALAPAGTYYGGTVNGNMPWLDGFNVTGEGYDSVTPGRLPWTFGMGADPNNPTSGVLSLNGNNTVNTPSPQAAFDTYRNSTGYQFRLGQGMNAVNSGWAGKGLLQSGAALKGLNDYGQGMASAEFGNYLSALGNQQSLGFSAGSALAGVGQNYANSLGNIYTANGENQANAALIKGQNNPLANSLSLLGGGIFGLGKK